MPNEPRVMTQEEVREQYLKLVASYVNYWENESRATTSKEKLEGLAFSMLVILDGGAGMFPGFIMKPNVSKADQKWQQEQGENWFPNNVDIGGGLHEHIHNYFKK